MWGMWQCREDCNFALIKHLTETTERTASTRREMMRVRELFLQGLLHRFVHMYLVCYRIPEQMITLANKYVIKSVLTKFCCKSRI